MPQRHFRAIICTGVWCTNKYGSCPRSTWKMRPLRSSEVMRWWVGVLRSFVHKQQKCVHCTPCQHPDWFSALHTVTSWPRMPFVGLFSMHPLRCSPGWCLLLQQVLPFASSCGGLLFRFPNTLHISISTLMRLYYGLQACLTFPQNKGCILFIFLIPECLAHGRPVGGKNEWMFLSNLPSMQIISSSDAALWVQRELCSARLFLIKCELLWVDKPL